ncbi:unnamed protein product [Dicrocoelium dendriticum]|nr:unnamed protein product [Dicrocoelium dendriticum]
MYGCLLHHDSCAQPANYFIHRHAYFLLVAFWTEETIENVIKPFGFTFITILAHLCSAYATHFWDPMGSLHLPLESLHIAPDTMSLDILDNSCVSVDTQKHTLYPTCTGTSVIGIKYADGVIMAADTLVSYGSLARYMGIERVVKVVLGFSGDVADYQLLKKRIDEQTHMDGLLADGFTLSPKGLHSWITRVLYNRRSKMNPLWNTYLVGGLENDGKPYLGFCNLLGVSFTGDCIATGFGTYLVTPLLRQRLDDLAGGDPNNLTEAHAVQAVTDAMRQLYFRDCRAFNQYHMTFVRPDGVDIQGPLKLECDWTIAEYVAGYE